MEQKKRCWDVPISANSIAKLPARAAGADLLLSPAGGMIEVVGHWSHFECAIDAPISWLDVTFRLVRTIGGIDTILDIRALADMPNPITTGGRVAGLLFSIRGRPGDRFRVEAWNTEVDHGEAKFYAFAWGEDGIYGDRATRLPVEFVEPGQARTFTTGLAGLAPGPGATLVLSPNTTNSRGRVAITELVWTHVVDGVGGLTLTLRETDGTVRAVWATQAEAGAGAVGTEVRETWLAPPLFSGPGNGWELVLSGGAAGANLVNINGFQT